MRLGGSDRQGFTSLHVADTGAITAVASLSQDPNSPVSYVVVRVRSDGSLDPSFGTGGVSVPIGSTSSCEWSCAADLAVQSDGKVLVVFPGCQNASTGDVVVARLLPDGRPDSTFGQTGVVHLGTQYPCRGGFPRIVAAPDGKIVVASSTLLSGPLNYGSAEVTRLIIDGSIDLSFGQGGTTAWPGRIGLTAIMSHPDGSITASAEYETDVGDACGIGIARWLANGQPDPSFGVFGQQRRPLTPVLSGPDYCETRYPIGGLARQSGGGYVAAGGIESSIAHGLLAIVGFTSVGEPDNSFGVGGEVSNRDAALSGIDSVVELLADRQAGVLVAGNRTGFSSRGVIKRLTARGQRDPAFGTAGELWTVRDPNVNTGIAGIELQVDGKAVVAGSLCANPCVVGRTNSEALVARFAESLDGSLPPGAAASPAPPATSPPSTSQTPVVFIAGLDANNPLILAGEDCTRGTDFASLCRALRPHHPVYVIGAKAGGSSFAASSPRDFRIDSHGTIDDNARQLARFLQHYRLGPALFVGHSMGGLISRVAIARYGVQATGLVTLGSPHEGSFWADDVDAAVSLPCDWIYPRAARVSCLAVRDAARVIAADKGAAAIHDLTHAERTSENHALASLHVPVQTYAGTAVPWRTPGYRLPNDGVVGNASAWGTDAGLAQEVMCYSAGLWHNRYMIPGVYAPNNLYDDILVNNVVMSAANGLSPSGGRACKRRAAERVRVTPQGHRARLRAVPKQPSGATKLGLSTASVRRTSPGSRLAASPGDPVYATQAFAIKCDAGILRGVRLGAKLYGIHPPGEECARPALSSRSSVWVVRTSNTARVFASMAKRGTGWLLRIRAHLRIRRAVLREGRRTRRLTTQGRVAVISLRPLRHRERAQLVVTIGKRRYSGALPPVPA